MSPAQGKRLAEKAGLALYWDSQWRVWGLVGDYGTNEGSIWYASRHLHEMSKEAFEEDIAEMVRRQNDR